MPDPSDAGPHDAGPCDGGQGGAQRRDRRRDGGMLADYAACIDADALEEWPDYFTADCHYKITTAYNHANDLPVGLIYAHNRAMLEDRVVALRKANIYRTPALPPYRFGAAHNGHGRRHDRGRGRLPGRPHHA